MKTPFSEIPLRPRDDDRKFLASLANRELRHNRMALLELLCGVLFWISLLLLPFAFAGFFVPQLSYTQLLYLLAVLALTEQRTNLRILQLAEHMRTEQHRSDN
jgi:hypothetical protein